MRSSTTFSLALLFAAAATAQESRARFDAPVIQTGAWTRMERLLDADLDGDIDAVGAWTQILGATRSDLRVHLNDGNGGFASSLLVDTLTIAVNRPDSLFVEVGDWTGDGHADVAIAGPGVLNTYRTTAGVAPVPIERQTTTFTPLDLVALDADGDGRDDLALRTATSVELFLASGTGMVHAASWPQSGQDLIATEIDGDARADLVLVQGVELQCLAFDGNALVDAGRLVHGIASSQMPCAGDIDGDGDIDLVVFGATQYTVLRRTGGASFQAEPLATGGPATGLADIDGDGDLDGVCCGGGGPQPTPANSRLVRFHLSFNDGTGRFAPAFTMPNVGARELAGVADVDGDGDIDLVAGRGVYYSRGGVHAELQPVLRNLSGDRWPRLADVDGDGDVDFDVTLNGFEKNRADGTTVGAAPVLPAAPAGGAWFGPGYRGDFDGDGSVDLVVALYRGATFDTMHLLRNRGGGTFEDAGPATNPGEMFYPHPANPVHGEHDQLVADVDGDGDLDVVSNYSFALLTPAALAQFWINDGSGRFTRGTRLTDVTVLHVADFDGDRIRDAFVSRPSGLYYFLRGNADVTFGTNFGFVESMPVGMRFAIDDIDADGDLDLVSDDSVRPILWRNDGRGVFGEEHPIGASPMDWAPAALRSSFIADLDGDGRRDFVCYPAQHGGFHTAWVALQNGDGTFTRLAEQVIKPAELLDADGDGDLDVVGDRLVRGTRHHGAAAGRRVQSGVATAGTSRSAPTLGATGPFRAGEQAASRITGGLGGTFAVYFLGITRVELADFPLAGLTTYTWPVLSSIPVWLGGAPGVGGAGSLTLPYTVPATIAGWRLYVQTFVFDPAATSSVTQTNLLEITYGR